MRNLRAAGGGEVRLGRTREAIRVEELPDDAKPPILREYPAAMEDGDREVL